ncbi:MAG: preprotein translocase subunit SecE [Candidatus Cyclobacteriaceae bacterium M3_2C_046]
MKLKSFVLDSYNELRNKVSWPKYSELQNSSILVLVASLIFALIIGLIDLAFRGLLQEWFYQVF